MVGPLPYAAPEAAKTSLLGRYKVKAAPVHSVSLPILTLLKWCGEGFREADRRGPLLVRAGDQMSRLHRTRELSR